MKIENEIEGFESLVGIATTIALVFVAYSLSGCHASHGWRFEVGVSPVNNLSNEAGFAPIPPPREKEKY